MQMRHVKENNGRLVSEETRAMHRKQLLDCTCSPPNATYNNILQKRFHYSNYSNMCNPTFKKSEPLNRLWNNVTLPAGAQFETTTLCATASSIKKQQKQHQRTDKTAHHAQTKAAEGTGTHQTQSHRSRWA